jgi:hypothetical protein
MRYIEKNNTLPQNMFEHLKYEFHVLKDGEKWVRISYLINSDEEIIDKTIVVVN